MRPAEPRPPEPPVDRPAPVRPGEELDLDRLATYLAEHLPVGEAPSGRGAADDAPPRAACAAAGRPPSPASINAEQFPSGFSNLTYLIHWGGRRLVLRRPPFGSRVATAHDMAREHRILSALAPVYPKAPRPLLFCDDPAVLGAPFYLMERVEGVILRASVAREPVPPPPERLAAAAGALVDTLAELHAVDFRAAGLGDLGRPEGYVERQVAGWTGRYRRAAEAIGEGGATPEMDRVAAWLTERVATGGGPPGGASATGAALIHNDLKHDNLVLAPDDWGRVLAVLDWEMATVGDPLMDLGTTLGYWVDPGDPPEMVALGLGPTALPGNPDRAAVVDRYARASGRDPGDAVFLYVYGLFKLAVIAQQIYARYVAGHTRDPRFARLDRSVAACARTAGQAIALGRIDRLYQA